MPIMSRNQNGTYDEIPYPADQVYSAASTNAQSGVAVAQALQDSGSEYSARVMNLVLEEGDATYLQDSEFRAYEYQDGSQTYGTALNSMTEVTIQNGTTYVLRWRGTVDGVSTTKFLPNMFSQIGVARLAPDYPSLSLGWKASIFRIEHDSTELPDPLPDNYEAMIMEGATIGYNSSTSYTYRAIEAPPMKPDKHYDIAIRFFNDNESASSFTCDLSNKFIGFYLQEPSNQPIMYDGVTRQQFIMPKGIKSTDYATQTTGGTIKAWTTTDGSDTILHLATQ